MKIPSFIGGTDEQRSTNLSENQLINLCPVTNNDGTIAAFYKVDGLKSEGTLSGVPTGAYKASNGRAFYTSGTVLYELTVPGGVYTSTSRGTITTATNYEFSDNGLEMIMVNGTDGWIFTFATNTLLKIIVLSGNFTVQAATSVDVDAILTKTAHGLIVGDRVILTTTGSLPANLLPNTPYYVLADSFTVNSFKVGLTLTGATCTISNASPCVISSASHGFFAGDKIRFLTTGTLPSPLVVGTIYYVISAGITQDSFRISLTSDGVAINTTTAGSGVHSFNPVITIIQTGLTTCTIRNNISSGICTFTIATPSVFTKVAHELQANDRVYFAILGGIANGMTAINSSNSSVSTLYYVISTGLTADTFQVSLTQGGTGIAVLNTPANPCYVYPSQQGRIIPSTQHSFSVGDQVRLKTTGVLPTGLTVDTDYYVSGMYGYFYEASGFLYLSYNSQTTIAGKALKIFCDGLLPSGITSGETYYPVSAASGASYTEQHIYLISTTQNGSTISASGYVANSACSIIEDDVFCLSTTLANAKIATTIAISGTQSGTHSYFREGSISFGTHTYTTSGAGFPNGAKQVKYMNGRFIACEPNTQNFYVSEVLDGRTWDAINVQTVDSNPDYVTGIEVSHNELVVFCENSGETYYDSGSTPTPFVRNLTGIFNVGCKAPYTIKEIGGAIMFLGNSSSGNGIVYRMQGLTPVRVSTYSIEYQIQLMSDISDARALVYQKDGHHFYVLTFPTGNKTFVFDVSTSLWHERSESIYSSTSSAAAVKTYGITISGDGLFAYTNNYTSNVISMFNRNTDTGVLTALSPATISTGASPVGICISADGLSLYSVNYLSSSVSMYSRNTTTGLLTSIGTIATGTNPYHICISSDGVSVYVTNLTSNTVSMFSRNISTGALTSIGTIATGLGPYGINMLFDDLFIYVTNSTSNTISMYNRDLVTGLLTSIGSIATGLHPYGIKSSSDGVSIYVANGDDDTISMYSRNLVTGLLTPIGTIACGDNPYGIDVTKNNSIVYVANYGANTVSIYDRDLTTGLLTAQSPATLAAGTNPIWIASSTDGNMIYVTNYNGTTISIFVTSYSEIEWPVIKYLYFNGKHLITDSTTSLFSIDSSTYKNGTNIIRVVRSFRAPASDMKRVAHHTIQVDCEVGIGSITEPVIALRWSDDAGNTWSTPIEKGLGIAGEHSKRVIFRRLGATKGIPRIYELSCVEDVKMTLLDCYLE